MVSPRVNHHRIKYTLGVVALSVLCSTGVWAQRTAADYFPDEPDPLVGDWVGRWTSGEKVDPTIAAQVFPLGGNRYRMRFVAKLDMRCPPKLIVDVEKENGALAFEEDGYWARTEGDTMVGGRTRGSSAFELKKVTRLSPTLGAEPPEDAIVLFDGSGFDAWHEPEGWELLDDGVMMVTPTGDYLESKQKFRDLKLHIEFRTPLMPRARGQQRGNSGVFIQDVYEVQVLDSYGLEGYYNDCGALYKVSAPHVNACRPPLQWQTYDIEYRAPRYDADGELAENARMTVRHNGVLIHNDQELWWITAWTEAERKAPPPREPGSIRLQAHSNYVQFRNVWVQDLSNSADSK